jgi:hypothetical protein
MLAGDSHHRLGELIDQVVHGGLTVSASARAARCDGSPF